MQAFFQVSPTLREIPKLVLFFIVVTHHIMIMSNACNMYAHVKLFETLGKTTKLRETKQNCDHSEVSTWLG